jgi:UDP-N-acetylglucosamine--N-acetylmuramyl-(pentapeptide) pyrophosphoryl-undecaprenol N-acetylglucosamine transferase
MKQYAPHNHLVLAGGGTAGHIEPALAVARAWRERYPESRITFLGTSSGLETSLVPQAGFDLHLIPKVSISRSVSPTLLAVPLQLIRSVATTLRVVRTADCAIGFGGYVSAPLYVAAKLARKPFVIHEQNAKAGWANRVGASFTKFVALSYPVAEISKGVVTGLPLRRDVVNAVRGASHDWSNARLHAKKKIAALYGFSEEDPIIFIFGGSQGSLAINKVINKSIDIFHKSSCSVIHGIGRGNQGAAQSAHYVAVEYITDMADHYLAADLIIARSGAVTCAETAALGKYALFIPLPIGNGEQALNADSLQSAGRAEILTQSEFSPHWIEQNLDRILAKSSSLTDMGNTEGLAAVDKILDMLELASGK